MKQTLESEIEASRRWLHERCHHAGVRDVLERGLEFFAAMDRAGLSPFGTTGDELYGFLSDPSATRARSQAFVSPTL